MSQHTYNSVTVNHTGERTPHTEYKMRTEDDLLVTYEEGRKGERMRVEQLASDLVYDFVVREDEEFLRDAGRHNDPSDDYALSFDDLSLEDIDEGGYDTAVDSVTIIDKRAVEAEMEDVDEESMTDERYHAIRSSVVKENSESWRNGESGATAILNEASDTYNEIKRDIGREIVPRRHQADIEAGIKAVRRL